MVDEEAARLVDLDRVRTQAAEHAHGAWQSLLHDQVVVALRAAATPGVGRLEVRRCARAALSAIDDLADGSAGGPTDLMAALRNVPTSRGLVAVDGPDAWVVPAPVAGAILGAVVEAVRNVERHAPGADAQVQVRCDDEVTTVRVVDDGPGFVHRRWPLGGLRVSVAAPMARAGGSAQVDSTPGQGTVVTLTWPAGADGADATSDGPSAEVWRTVSDEVHARRRARLEEIVVPLLHQLSDADRVDDDLRVEAELAEQAVRDEMHLPEVLDPPTRESIRAARAQGCRVRVQSDATTGVPTVSVVLAAQVNQVVRVALSTQPTPRELTLSVYAHAVTGQARVAVVAVPGSPARRDALHRALADCTDTLTDDEDATWAEIRVPG